MRLQAPLTPFQQFKYIHMMLLLPWPYTKLLTLLHIASNIHLCKELCLLTLAWMVIA